jgi:hypothetical protein
MTAYDLDNFARRRIEDALADGMPATWLRRAEMFEWAKPRPGEYFGQATQLELRRRWRELDEIARACRSRAQLCDPDEFVAELTAVLDDEVAS